MDWKVSSRERFDVMEKCWKDYSSKHLDSLGMTETETETIVM